MNIRLTIAVVFILCAETVLGGGIITNTNQSAEYVRTLNRNASTAVDAVYYNPAGLTELQEGVHLYLSNQFIFQTREITNDFPVLSQNTYDADVNAPLFPNIYGVYKTGDLAVSGGIAPVGGGGSAEYPDGAPSFELMVMQQLQANPQIPQFTGLQMEASFDGSSAYVGAQAGVSYAVNDMLSLALGGRYVIANNSYEGSISDIRVATAQGDVPIQGLELNVDATQSGGGFGGIIGVNLAPNEDLNIGLRYETLTPLEVENETETDDAGLFPDGQKVNQDIPALLAAGISLNLTPKLRTEVGANYFMNSGAEWSETDQGQTLAEDDFEAGVALEYQFTPDILASAGYLYSGSGAQSAYQQDIDFSLPSNSVAVGVEYRLMPSLDVNIGLINTFYMEDTKTLNLNLGPGMSMEQTYMKTSMDIALGISYSP